MQVHLINIGNIGTLFSLRIQYTTQTQFDVGASDVNVHRRTPITFLQWKSFVQAFVDRL